MNGTIDLYYNPASPASRSVMMVSKAIGVTLNLKPINLLAGDHMTPEYLKMNPQHRIPTLDDNGFILWESPAIMQYLVNQYAADDKLNPKEPKKAALVSQRMYFDSSTLYNRLYDYFFPVLVDSVRPDPARASQFEEALGFLDEFLDKSVWVAGDSMTVADFAIIVTISTAEAVFFDVRKYPNISSWYRRAKKAMAEYGYEEINEAGAAKLGALYKSKLK